MSEDIQQEIETLSIDVVNQYGCSEICVIGYGVNEVSKFKILEENVFIEILDESGNPIWEEDVVGDIVVTSRYQRLIPFVRYRVGDRGKWVAGQIGRELNLANNERESGFHRWGEWDSGSRYFRIMLARAYTITGYLHLEHIQVREENFHDFLLATNDVPQRAELCNALDSVCNAREYDAGRAVSKRMTFKSAALSPKLAFELSAKPCLFLPNERVIRQVKENYF